MAAFLPALMCGGGMVLCMWLMSRGHSSSQATTPGPKEQHDGEVAELREELRRLRAEMGSRANDEQPA